MRYTYTTSLLAFASIAKGSPIADPAPIAEPTFGSLTSWWTSFCSKFETPAHSVPAWPPAPPSPGCPQGWPKPAVPWSFPQYHFPGPCKPIHMPVSTPDCTKTTTPPPSSSPPSGHQYFYLNCPDMPAGSINDGQIQCNSPYPAQAAADPSQGPAATDAKFYLNDGALFDQFDRACEISSGNQLQCNKIADNSQAMKGFAMNTAGQLEFNAENTWYGCNIGSQASYGQILFTGTHMDFTGNQKTTSNANCDAYHLTIAYA